MKTKEFIRQVEELGYKTVKVYSFITIYDPDNKGGRVAVVSMRNERQLSISDAIYDLTKLLIEYADTPLAEREDEKKYNLILGTETDGDTNALVKNNPCTDAALWLNTDTYADDLKLDELYQFTQEEIDKYNKDFWVKNIDLNDYKIEVTDDEQ